MAVQGFHLVATLSFLLYSIDVYFTFRPELKPVEKDTEVIMK